jgi:hypothetical protein
MNERIQELADQMDQSGIPYQAGDILMTITDRYLEKFAELIVKECAKIANRQFEAATGLDDRDSLTAAEMKKHFGVEL